MMFDGINHACPSSFRSGEACLDPVHRQLLRRYVKKSGGNGGESNNKVDEYDEAEPQQDTRSTEQQLDDCTDGEGFRRVRYMSLALFQAKLIEHFDVAYRKKEVEWPGGGTK